MRKNFISCHPDLCQLDIHDELKQLYSPNTIFDYEKQKTRVGFEATKEEQAETEYRRGLEAKFVRADRELKEHEAFVGGAGMEEQFEEMVETSNDSYREIRKKFFPGLVKLDQLHKEQINSFESRIRFPILPEKRTIFVLNKLWAEHKSQRIRAAIVLSINPRLFDNFHRQPVPQPPDKLAHLSHPAFASMFTGDQAPDFNGNTEQDQQFTLNGKYWDSYPVETIITQNFAQLDDSIKQNMIKWIKSLPQGHADGIIIDMDRFGPSQGLLEYARKNESHWSKATVTYWNRFKSHLPHLTVTNNFFTWP